MKWSILCGSLLVLMMSCSKQPKTVEEVQEPVQMIDVIVGTYTADESEGIYSLKFDPSTGEIGDKSLLVKTSNPSYLVQNSDRSMVYAVNEDEEGGVSAFRWNGDKTALDSVNSRSVEGMHPCYIDFKGSFNLIAVANYSSGNVSTLKLNGDGSLSDEIQVMQHVGSGPTERQEGPHAHCSIFGSNKWLYAVDLGLDQIIAYPSDINGLGEPHVAFQLEPGDGPRHLTFHPKYEMAFIISELTNTIVSLEMDSDKGEFKALGRFSTLPEEYSGESFCADIHVSKDGKFLYASNRGHNSIAVFSISEKGQLLLLQTEPVQGEWPRNFTLSPDGEYLLVANQFTNNVVVFKVDKSSGLVTNTGNQAHVSSPVYLGF